MKIHKLKFKNLFIILTILIIITCSICLLKKENTLKKAICKNCNIILIDVDCLRLDHLGIYGYPKNTTPYLDKFAENSIVFKNFFSEGSMTRDGMMSVHTSLYPYIHGINELPGNEGEEHLNPKFLTMSQILNESGYSTVFVGASPERVSVSLSLGFGRGFKHVFQSYSKQNFDWDNGLEWIKNNKYNKFFVSFYSSNLHEPYTPSKKNLYKFTNRTDIEMLSTNELNSMIIEKIVNNPEIVFKDEFIKENPELFLNKKALRKYLNISWNDNLNQHTSFLNVAVQIFYKKINTSNSEDVELMKALYDSLIYEEDQHFSSIIETLKQEGLLNKTIIIFYSDHGEEFGEHGLYGHGNHLYDEVIHTPLIIFVPGMENKEINALTGGVDIMPTLLGLVGIKTPKQAQGKSLLPVMLGTKKSVREYAHSEGLSSTFSIRSNEWKYITNFKGNEEFYNLKQDPGEKENLISIKPGVASEMREKLEEHLKEPENIDAKKERLNINTFKRILIILTFLLIVIVILPKRYFKIKTER